MNLQVIKNRLDEYCAQLIQENLMFVKANEGTLSAEQWSAFIANAGYMVTHTPIHLEMARKRAVALNKHDLAKFFEDKLSEEQGHDQWAKEDLGHLASSPEPSYDLLSGPVLPPVYALARFLEQKIQDDPAIYLLYVLFAEYATVICGPLLTTNLSEKCRISTNSMTVISNHIELDKDHIMEDFNILNHLFADDTAGLSGVESEIMLNMIFGLHASFCNQIGGTSHGSK